MSTTLLNQIRAAIKSSDKSRYRLACETGILQSHLSRLMGGTAGLSLERLEVLAEALELEITITPKRKGK